jgi:hypothetical protein
LSAFQGNQTGKLTAGEIRLAGDFYANAGATFTSTGTTVVLDGSAPQNVSFVAAAPSGAVSQYFHDLHIENPTTVTFHPIYIPGGPENRNGARVRGELRVAAPATVDGAGAITISGNLTTVVGSRITVARLRLGGSLGTTAIEGEFSVPLLQFFGTNPQPMKPGLAYRNVLITAPVRLVGPTSVAGYLRIGSDNGLKGPLDFNGQTLTVEGDFLTASGDVPMMVNTADRLVVGGNIDLQGGDTRGKLTAGEVYAAGDFSAGMWNFSSTGTKVILNGTSVQKVQITTNFTGATRSYFHDLEITNPAGAEFLPVPNNGLVSVRNLDLKGAMTVRAGTRMQVVDTLFLRSTSKVINNGTLQVKACVRDTGHTVEGTDPCPAIAPQTLLDGPTPVPGPQPSSRAMTARAATLRSSWHTRASRGSS